MRWYWPLVAAAIGARLDLLCFADSLNLAFRPEVATPLTSLRRLAEEYWLKQSSMSPYAGLAPLAAFGWVMATQFSLYPAVLVLPVILLLGHGPDGPPPKLFRKSESEAGDSNSSKNTHEHDITDQTALVVLETGGAFHTMGIYLGIVYLVTE